MRGGSMFVGEFLLQQFAQLLEAEVERDEAGRKVASL